MCLNLCNYNNCCNGGRSQDCGCNQGCGYNQGCGCNGGCGCASTFNLGYGYDSNYYNNSQWTYQYPMANNAGYYNGCYCGMY